MPSPEPVPPPRIVVLMSTYNGERFVVEQLRSILPQLPESGRITVRDDGSSDGTVATIEGIADPRISVSRGANLGFGRSFLTLLAAVPPDADLVMFADQDDVWLPGKIERAWQHLLPLAGSPALYGSAQMLVDSKLRPLHPTRSWPKGPSLGNALCENIITGCTAALNRQAINLLQRSGVPDGVYFHDWWLYLVISAFGTVIYDEQPSLLYRQHSSNQIGHGAGWFGRYLGMTRFLLRRDWAGIMLGQITALFRYYDDQLDSTNRTLILDLFDVQAGGTVPRWQLMFDTRQLRQRPAEDLALRLLLTLHRLHVWPLPNRRI